MELSAERVLDHGEGCNFGVDHGGCEGHGEEELQLIPDYHNNLIFILSYAVISFTVLSGTRFYSPSPAKTLSRHELVESSSTLFQ